MIAELRAPSLGDWCGVAVGAGEPIMAAPAALIAGEDAGETTRKLPASEELPAPKAASLADEVFRGESTSSRTQRLSARDCACDPGTEARPLGEACAEFRREREGSATRSS